MNRVFLLADDDADDIAIFNEAIVGIAPTIECHTAENGLSVFDVLLEHRPDVIFLDINMPIMNGWECLRRLKSSAEYERIPVIMYSTSSAKRDVDLAYSLGASLFITKPEDFSELSKILEAVATELEDAPLSRFKAFASVRVS